MPVAMSKLKQKSPAEFFAENQNIAGFDNPGKSLYTTMREFVENSLDATEAVRRTGKPAARTSAVSRHAMPRRATTRYANSCSMRVRNHRNAQTRCGAHANRALALLWS